ncbi:MAG: acyl-CoA dehydrogenase [Deltaproteobacteria bacterium]|nr:MAG: acyl-CoA dehydrogenase [Deltaproteobacteria bacterium]
MKLADDPEVFRDELADWLEANAPRSLWNTVSTPFQGHWGGRNCAFPSPDHKLWFERCVALGWTAPHWPSEYGGADMPTSHYRVFREALSSRGLPMPLVGTGLTMIGPILLAEGNDAQKAEHLPKIASGEIRWCQGYSEPGAGSDLANLQCKAVLDGDEYVVNGQKIWTSHADKSDWIFCLVRTKFDGKKQGGISFLLFDMNTPGITVRPIQLISGASPFCEVFFEDVRVPASNRVGAENDGWRVAKALLAHERGMVGESIAAGGARLPELQAYNVREHALEVFGKDATGRLADASIRERVVQSEMDQALARITVRRVNEGLKAGQSSGPVSSTLKILGTELNQRRWELGVEIAGPDGLGWSGDAFSDRDRALARQWLRSKGNTIEGGSSEVQRNIIARMLGLPKGA